MSGPAGREIFEKERRRENRHHPEEILSDLWRIGDRIESAGNDIPIEGTNIGYYHNMPRGHASVIMGRGVRLTGQKIVGVSIPQTEKRICVRCIAIDLYTFNLVTLRIPNLDFEHTAACPQIAGVFDKTIVVYHNFCALGSDVMTDAQILENRHYENQNGLPIQKKSPRPHNSQKTRNRGRTKVVPSVAITFSGRPHVAAYPMTLQR